MTNRASARVPAKIRPPYLPYKRRTTSREYRTYPETVASTGSNNLSVFPPRSPSTAHPHLKGDFDRQRFSATHDVRRLLH
jgi:hypothetical protein